MRGHGVVVQPFLTSVLYGGEWSASRLSSFIPATHWIEVCVSRSGHCEVEKNHVPPLGIEPGAVEPIHIPTELSRHRLNFRQFLALIMISFFSMASEDSSCVRPRGYCDP
jgi:hypothetical protein